MPDEQSVVRGIDWKTAFPFTLIFRSFRVAIHPSKLVLALLAVILIYAGGRILDSIWPSSYSAVPNEVRLYQDSRAETDPAQQFKQRRADVRKQIEDAYDAEKKSLNATSLSDLRNKYVSDRTEAVKAANDAYNSTKGTTPEDERKAAQIRDAAIASAYSRASERFERSSAINGVGLFHSLWAYQVLQMHHVVGVARSGDWLGRAGLVDALIDLLTAAPGWAITRHPIYFTIFGIYFLVIWAVFGGAIARIAAVQVARDEKISFRQALSFSTAKFLSFVSAPIIPVVIIVVVGLVVTAGALILFNIPFLGPILGGALFFLALAAGFVMTLVLIGLLGGINLMYPTVAVEGSDSFDAISRSFSYLFARPWRLVFYTMVAAVYGTICYVFVRYFIMLMLSLTRYFANWGVFVHADNTQPLWSMLWPNPMAHGALTYSVDHLSLTSGQDIGAFFIAFWVYLTISVLAAFAISFYFSANTVIYILMRHEVDATELDDVYLEQTDEEFTESTTVTATTTTVTTETPAPPSSEGSAPQTPPA